MASATTADVVQATTAPAEYTVMSTLPEALEGHQSDLTAWLKTLDADELMEVPGTVADTEFIQLMVKHVGNSDSVTDLAEAAEAASEADKDTAQIVNYLITERAAELGVAGDAPLVEV